MQRFTLIRSTVLLSCCIPATWLLGEYWIDALGINPLNRLLHFSGRWALYFLLLTLAITPARRLGAWLAYQTRRQHSRRLADWNWLVRLRRMLGLASFFYALLHAALYISLDQDWDWHSIVDDLRERPFIVAGAVALLLLVPLAITSPNAMMRKLGGRRWRTLHRSIYLIGILEIAHFWWQSKHGHYAYLPYAIILAALLLYRLVAVFKNDRDTGMEIVRQRSGQTSASAPAD